MAAVGLPPFSAVSNLASVGPALSSKCLNSVLDKKILIELTYLKSSITPYCGTIMTVSIATKIDNGVRVAVDNLVVVLTQSFIDLFV